MTTALSHADLDVHAGLMTPQRSGAAYAPTLSAPDAAAMASLLCETLEAYSSIGWDPHESALEALALAMRPIDSDQARLIASAINADVDLTALLAGVRRVLPAV